MRDSLRQALLLEDPGIGPVDMRTLVGMTTALEHESQRRYEKLADTMEQRGKPDTAAAFLTLRDEERSHVDALARWAGSLDEPMPAPEEFARLVPAELSNAWNEVAGSALLTPYRAFSIAVLNEQRTFSLYSYLAAHATSERVRAEAERLAGEALRHAGLIRRWRREAWHRARREAPSPATRPITDVAALRHLLGTSLAGIDHCHAAVAQRLREIGDEASARIVEQQLALVEQQAVATPGAGSEAEPDAAIAACKESLPLLVLAQRPLEALADRLEATMASAQGELFDETSQAMDSLVKRLASIASRAMDLQSGAH